MDAVSTVDAGMVNVNVEELYADHLGEPEEAGKENTLRTLEGKEGGETQWSGTNFVFAMSVKQRRGRDYWSKKVPPVVTGQATLAGDLLISYPVGKVELQHFTDVCRPYLLLYLYYICRSWKKYSTVTGFRVISFAMFPAALMDLVHRRVYDRLNMADIEEAKLVLSKLREPKLVERSREMEPLTLRSVRAHCDPVRTCVHDIVWPLRLEPPFVNTQGGKLVAPLSTRCTGRVHASKDEVVVAVDLWSGSIEIKFDQVLQVGRAPRQLIDGTLSFLTPSRSFYGFAPSNRLVRKMDKDGAEVSFDELPPSYHTVLPLDAMAREGMADIVSQDKFRFRLFVDERGTVVALSPWMVMGARVWSALGRLRETTVSVLVVMVPDTATKTTENDVVTTMGDWVPGLRVTCLRPSEVWGLDTIRKNDRSRGVWLVVWETHEGQGLSLKMSASPRTHITTTYTSFRPRSASILPTKDFVELEIRSYLHELPRLTGIVVCGDLVPSFQEIKRDLSPYCRNNFYKILPEPKMGWYDKVAAAREKEPSSVTWRVLLPDGKTLRDPVQMPDCSGMFHVVMEFKRPRVLTDPNGTSRWDRSGHVETQAVYECFVEHKPTSAFETIQILPHALRIGKTSYPLDAPFTWEWGVMRELWENRTEATQDPILKGEIQLLWDKRSPVSHPRTFHERATALLVASKNPVLVGFVTKGRAC